MPSSFSTACTFSIEGFGALRSYLRFFRAGGASVAASSAVASTPGTEEVDSTGKSAAVIDTDGTAGVLMLASMVVPALGGF